MDGFKKFLRTFGGLTLVAAWLIALVTFISFTHRVGALIVLAAWLIVPVAFLSHRVARVASVVLVSLPIVFSILVGFFVVGQQCLNWLRFGYWEEMTLQDGLYGMFGQPFFSETGWLGTDKIIDWSINNLPLALWFLIILPIIWRVIWQAIVIVGLWDMRVLSWLRRD
jgi:hypothetical protein